MFIKIISLTFSYSLRLFVNHSFKQTYSADFEALLLRRGANSAKEMFRKKRIINKLEKLEELSQKKGSLEKY